MTCNCIDNISKELTEHNLDTAIMWPRDGGTLTSRTYTSLTRKDNGRAETRSKMPRIFAHTFCPFCGERYDPVPAEVAGEPA